MPGEWALRILVLIIKGKGGMLDMQFLEHGMKVVESVLEKRFH